MKLDAYQKEMKRQSEASAKRVAKIRKLEREVLRLAEEWSAIIPGWLVLDPADKRLERATRKLRRELAKGAR